MLFSEGNNTRLKLIGSRTLNSGVRPADQEVYHDPDHPSAIILPVQQAG